MDFFFGPEVSSEVGGFVLFFCSGSGVSNADLERSCLFVVPVESSLKRRVSLS